MRRPPVIITRTQPGNTRTAKAVRALGWRPIACPVAQVVRSRARIQPGKAAALALTSANAVRAIADPGPLFHLPVFTVGAGTELAAREAGFSDATSADGDAEALARLIAARMPDGSAILHLSGEDRAGDLGGMLEVMGYPVETRTVYRTRLARGLTVRASRALEAGPAIVLIHSARGAERFLTLTGQAQLSRTLARLTFIALSERAAAPLHRHGLRVHVAAEPAEAHLLARLGELAECAGAP